MANETGRVGLRSISLRNFKGVGDETVVIPLSPITLLFGGNSSGKSTVLHALLLIRSVLCHGSVTVDKSSGGVDLGGFENYVHQHDVKRKLEIGIELGLDDDGLQAVPALGLPEVQEVGGAAVKMVFRLCIEDWENVSLRVETFYDGHFLAQVWDDAWGAEYFEIASAVPPNFKEAFGEDVENKFRDYVEEHTQDTEFLHEREGRYVGCQIRDQRIRLRPVSPANPRSADDLPFWDEPEFSDIFAALTLTPIYDLTEQLRKMRHVGPLRTLPPRGFKTADFPEIDSWSDGLAAWRYLYSNAHLADLDTPLLEAIRSLDLGYSVEEIKTYELNELNPVIAALLQGQARRDEEISVDLAAIDQNLSKARKQRLQLVETASGQPVDLQDVGIGVSQVLPILVAARKHGSTLVAMEQPELHIHPRIQCLLADILAKTAIETDRLLLIETHSEHLILRLLRRLREKNYGILPQGAPELEPSLISVVTIGKVGGVVNITPIQVTADGDFEENWPEGFFEERVDELF